jgi:hypothetical protein
MQAGKREERVEELVCIAGTAENLIRLCDSSAPEDVYSPLDFETNKVEIE